MANSEYKVNLKELHGKSLLLFSADSPIRKACCRIVHNKWFDRIILVIILLNSIVLGMADYNKVNEDGELVESGSWRNTLVEVSEPVFTALFAIEMLIKVITMGFLLGPHAYIRDGWNVLDFIVVMAGVLTTIPGMPNVSALRTIRVLRPLRSLTVLPGMRVLVSSLLGSIPALMNVVILLTFVFFIFGIVGVQLWSGLLHARCRITEKPVQLVPLSEYQNGVGTFAECRDPDTETCISMITNNGQFQPGRREPVFSARLGMFVHPAINDSTIERCPDVPGPQPCFWPIDFRDTRVCSLSSTGMHSCELGRWCGSNFFDDGDKRFVDKETMRMGTFLPDLNYGYTNFDNIFAAFITIFQSITLEGWVVVMYMVQDAFNAVVAALYFVFLILFGSFFLLNLTLAVIWDKFQDGQEKERADKAEADNATAETKVEKGKDEKHNVQPAIAAGAELATATTASMPPRRSTNKVADASSSGMIEDGVQRGDVNQGTDASATPLGNDNEKSNDGRPVARDTAGKGSGADDMELETMSNAHSDRTSDRPNGIENEGSDVLSPLRPKQDPQYQPRDGRVVVVRGGNRSGDGTGPPSSGNPLARATGEESPFVTNAVPVSQDTSHDRADAGFECTLYGVVTSPIFQGFVILLIVMNTVVLAWDHYPMDQRVAENLEAVNFVLTLLFTVEMILKIIGLGPRAYARDSFNLFDALIVIVSLIEIAVAPPGILTPESGDIGGGGAISAMRTFRLFRVFKLAKSWRSLSTLLKTIIRTLRDVANFAILLALFMYIFALVGMQFFANRFCFSKETGLPRDDVFSHCDPDIYEHSRSNFDDLFWSLVTVFQILSEEDWNTIMYNGRRATSWAATLYFVILVVMGNFIVLNLFLAILLGNFEGMEELLSTGRKEREAEGPKHISPLSKFFSRWRGDNKRIAPIQSAASVILTVASRATQQHQREMQRTGERVLQTAGVELVPQKKTAANYPANPEIVAVPIVSHHSQTESHQSTHKEMSNGMENPSQPVVQPHPRNSALTIAGEAARGRHSTPTSGMPMATRPGKVAGESAESMCTQDAFRLVPPALGERKDDKPLLGVALWLLPPTHPLRMWVARMVRHPVFDGFILFIIFVSSVMLALDNPLHDPNSTLVKVLYVSDIVFVVLFTLEMVLKVIAYGFVFQKYAYLRDGWNVLDFFIVIVSILALSASGNASLKSLRSLRALRALRPLRVISRLPGLRLVINALFSSVKAIFNVLFVCLLFFLIFGIVGVNYFKGSFMACQGSAYEALSPEQKALVFEPVVFQHLSPVQQSWFIGPSALTPYGWRYSTFTSDAPTSRDVCNWLGAEFTETVTSNFNNIYQSMRTLFEMATTEGWVDIMHAGVDSRGVEMQPERDHQRAWALFFVLFLIVGSFFVLNLFVGVVIDNFNHMKEQLGGESVFMTESQRQWVKAQKVIAKLRPEKLHTEPKGRTRKFCYQIASSRKFEYVIMGCIIANALVMAMSYFGQPTAYGTALEGINFFFAAVFTIEAVLKLTAYHCDYFRSGWNRFDFAIVAGTNIGIILQLALGLQIGAIAAVVRTFRIGRMFRLIKSAKSLNHLFNTLILTLPSLGNIGGLLFLLFFIYAVMGVQLFALVEYGDDLNVHANFRGFWIAVLTLMRSATGESWNFIMYDLATDRPNCIDVSELYWSLPGCETIPPPSACPPTQETMCGFSDADDCLPLRGCGTPTSYPFFISFTLLVTFIFLNLFIAVILEGFSETSEDDTAELSEDDFDDFRNAWKRYDPRATGFMSTTDLLHLIQDLREPMGFGAEVNASKRMLMARVKRLRLRVYEGNVVYFQDVSAALARRVFELTATNKGEPFYLPDNHLPVPSSRSLKHAPTVKYNVDSYFAALVIQQSFHAYMFRKRINERVENCSSDASPSRRLHMNASDDDVV